MQLFGTSGIRAIADKDLFQLAFRVGLAVGGVYDNLAVATDTRTSGEAMKHALIGGMLAAGASCSDIGVAPTPTLALSARQFDAGAMITASHNPPQYNGIKLLNPDGSAFDAAQQAQIEKLVQEDSARAASWQELKSLSPYYGAIERHIEHILKYFPGEHKLKVVVDSGCGAASLVTPHLLRKLGCRVTTIDCYPSGFFPRDVEPTEANLGNLMAAVRSLGADLGVCHDGDADRMMAVDGKGRFIPGDKLLAIFVRAAGAKEVVTTIDASMIIEETGLKVRRTRVGDTYVSDELKKGGQFGGEPSGAWVFPESSFCPDGIYAAARIVSIASQQELAGLVDAIRAYPILRGSVTNNGLDKSNLELKLLTLRPQSVDKIDGIKLNFKDGWLLVRPSGTEPKIRLTAEARDQARARQLYDSGLRALKG